MGKPYASELQLLATTYSWALQKDVITLAEGIASATSTPLVVTGSGGSLTAAYLTALLHQKYSKQVGKAVTPLELVSAMPSLKNACLMLLSAGGRNSDILGAFKQSVIREPNQMIVVCSRINSPLGNLAKEYRFVNLFDFNLPAGKDGFLATNSLLAFATLLCRAYTEAFSGLVEDQLPDTFQELIEVLPTQRELSKQCEPLWKRDTLVVLHSMATQPAALDLESKFTEAALGAVQVADYRNFAHGRHHWLAKRGATTAVLAFMTDEDRYIATKTLGLIPSDIPVVCIDIPKSGINASLRALIAVLQIAGMAGEARNIDPGRPGVPTFGSQIYNLRVFGNSAITRSRSSTIQSIAIERKSGVDVDTLINQGNMIFWKSAYDCFVQQLRTTSFKAVIFDFDGTLCDSIDRFRGISDEVSNYLKQFLEAGIIIGIATGRGKSVRKDLRDKLPAHLWSRVVIGYYNGSDSGLLNDDTVPDSTTAPCEALVPLINSINIDSRLAALASFEYRRTQITVQPKSIIRIEEVWNIVQQITLKAAIEGVKAVRSSHSIDVLAPGISKIALVEKVKQLVGASSAILCIGDRGQWPGNDFEFLSGPYSLSVDEVSPDPSTCWNLAPAGYRGVQATLNYLQALEVDYSLFGSSVRIFQGKGVL